MLKKYAIRITENNLDLIHALRPIVDVRLKEDINRYFLFTVASDKTTVEHDIVHEDDLYNYDGHLKDTRIILL